MGGREREGGWERGREWEGDREGGREGVLVDVFVCY